MLIGELAKKSGLTRDTIRFYEKHGLISTTKKERRFNNYKEYSEEILQRLRHIKLMKSFGFTLNEASELLDMIEVNQATCNNVSDKFDSKIKLLDDKIKELIQIRSLLLDGSKKCKNFCNPEKPSENCSILVA